MEKVESAADKQAAADKKAGQEARIKDNREAAADRVAAEIQNWAEAVSRRNSRWCDPRYANVVLHNSGMETAAAIEDAVRLERWRNYGKVTEQTKRWLRRLKAAAIKTADQEASKKADEEARKAEIKAAEDAAPAETAVGVEKVGPNLLDAETEVYDEGLLHRIWNSVRPLQLSSYDLQSIHRRFELYTECFPPDTNGRRRFPVDAETWQTYCDLQFS